MRAQDIVKVGKSILHRLGVGVGAIVLTLLLFMVLPLLQSINRPPTDVMQVHSVDIAQLEPPPPPPEDEPEDKEEEEEEPPPELNDEPPPLDLAQLELSLNTSFSGDWLSGDFSVKLNTAPNGGDDLDALFSMADLDQKPRIIYQPSPVMSAKVKKRAPGSVYIIFIVDRDGRVVNPIVKSSSDPIFEQPALAAVKQWKFEPGKRNGEPVQSRMGIPIMFPEG